MPDSCCIILTARVMVLDGAGVHHGLLHVAEGGEQPRVPRAEHAVHLGKGLV